MAQEIIYKVKCAQCGATGIYAKPGMGGGEMTCPWPGCNGTGQIERGIIELDPGTDDLMDKLNDVMDKLNDLEEKIDEL